jgi:trk system potassium uptake protein TrkH
VPPPPKKSSASDRLPPLAGDDDLGKELVNWLFPAYVTLIVLAILLFRLRGTMPQGQELSYERAVLTAVNSATLTGFPQKTPPERFKPFGQFLVLLLTVGGTLFSLIVGGLAVRRILRLPYSDRQVIRAAFICEGVALAIGAAGGCGESSSILGGFSQGAAVFGNSGVAAGTPFHIRAWQTHVIVLPMLFLGGIGITVLMELYDLFVHGRAISAHARSVLAWGLGLYVCGMIVLLLLRCIGASSSLDEKTFPTYLASSSIAAMNSRSGGIPFEFVHQYTRPMQWVLIVLMVIGAAPAGTGGGVKTTTIATIFGGARRLLRGGAAGQAMGIALAWLGLYLAIAFVGLLMLLFVQPQLAADQAVFMTISALSNVGLFHDILPDMPRGTYVIAALMLAGRMVPLLILWWMADLGTPAELAVG